METYFSCAMRTMTGKNGATYGAYENGGICLIPMQYSSAVNMVCLFDKLKLFLTRGSPPQSDVSL